MKIFPKGDLRKHLNRHGKWWLIWFNVDEEHLVKHVAHAAEQHDEESDEELKTRALFRIACQKRFPLTHVIAALLFIALGVIAARAQSVNIDRVGGTKVDPAVGMPTFCVSGCGGGTITANQGTAGASPWLVTGNVAVSWAAAQHVIVDSAPTTAVTGTFWQATQPISGSISNAFLLDATFTGRIPVLGQKAMSGSVPVVISSDQSSLAFDPQGPDAQAATQTGKPVQNGGRNAADGKIYTIGVDANGVQQMSTAVTGTVTLGNLPQQPFLNTTDFSDVVAGSPVLADVIYANSTPKWTKLAGSTLSAGGGFLNETQATLAAPSAPVLTVANTGGQFTQASGLTIYVTVTLINAFGETTQSAEASIAISTGNGCLAASTTCSVTVTAPTLTGNATGYTVYSDRDPGGEQQQTATSACVNITINCVMGLFGTGAAPATYNTASNGTLVAPTWKASSGSGSVVLANNATLAPQSLGLTLYADQFPGADICSKIQSAWLSLPATGGKIDATAFQGSQACASEPFLAAVDNSNKPFDLALGVVTINSTVNWYCPSNFHMHGLGDMTVIAFQPAGGAAEATKADELHCNSSSNVEIDHIKITGTANTGRLLSLPSGSNLRIHHNTFSGATYIPVAGPATALYIDGSSDVWIENNVFTNNGPGPASATSSTNADIITWNSVAENRVHIRNNQISGSHMEVSIGMYDCLDCDIIGNSIDQNNTITTTLTKGGYGIQVYSTNTRPRNVRIEGNHVSNAAGTCIYLASNDHAVVVGNDVQTCAQQETDGSLPVAGIAANDCGNCLIDGNTVKTSTLDGIDLVAPSLGSVISNNTIQTVTQNGIYLRTATDATVIGNQIQSATAAAIKDTGNRNHLIGNHILTSGANVTVASDFLEGNCIDATGCTFDLNNNSATTGFRLPVAAGAAPTVSGNISYDSTGNHLSAGINGTNFKVPIQVATGTSAMTTAGITTGACGTTVTTAATNALTTDTIAFTRNAAPTNANGGNLILNSWTTAGNVNWNYCNPSAGTVTPTAMTVNWAVMR